MKPLSFIILLFGFIIFQSCVEDIEVEETTLINQTESTPIEEEDQKPDETSPGSINEKDLNL